MESAGQVDVDVPEPDARYVLLGEADSADALFVFKNRIVLNADRAELQHILPRACPGNDNAAPAEYVGRAALVYARGSQNPQHRLVAAAPIDLQGMTVSLRAFLVPCWKRQRRTSRIPWLGGVGLRTEALKSLSARLDAWNRPRFDNNGVSDFPPKPCSALWIICGRTGEN
jgi:hypothetical protein